MRGTIGRASEFSTSGQRPGQCLRRGGTRLVGLLLAVTAQVQVAAAAERNEEGRFPVVWSIGEGLQTPESAYFDAASGFLFVSQVGGGGGAGKEGFFVTDWISGKLYHIDSGGRAQVLMSFPKGIADIGFLKERGWLIIPEMLENRLTGFDVSSVLD